MNNHIFTLKDIAVLIRPIAKKYKIKEVYLFGSYARGEADENTLSAADNPRNES